MENTRQQRSPAEIIEETEARLERLRFRQAQREAKTNPALSPLMDEKAGLTKAIREAKKLLGDGPQSAKARIAKHENWIEKIQHEVSVAKLVLAETSERMESVNAEIAQQVEALLETSEEQAIEA